MEENSCRTCQFFLANPETRETSWSNPEAIGQTGFCRRFPPQILWIDPQNLPDPNMQPGVNTFMPAVHAELWCGEYKFKGSGKSKSKSKSKK